MATPDDTIDRDLDLAVELVNTHWVLADPPDRLTTAADYTRIVREAGDDALADRLTEADLPELKALRHDLHEVFASESVEQAATHLNTRMAAAGVQAGLTSSNGQAYWAWTGPGRSGIDDLKARLLAALATHLVRHGTARMGVCKAAPCDCVYIDRSRARTRRFCCDQCNDRAAAAAYRKRRSG